MTEIKLTKRYPKSRTEDITDAFMRGWNDALDAVQNGKFHIVDRKDEPCIGIELNTSGLTINDFAQEIHQNSIEHGWWETERTLPEIIALCHSELSEALEAYRNGEGMIWMNDGKPDGIGVEMCDCIIRIFDYLAYKGFDIEQALEMKHLYNTTRPYKHGGKKI